MSDDDRDIDVESDVSSVVYTQNSTWININIDSLCTPLFQEGDDSDSRQPTPSRQSSGSQYYSQVNLIIRIVQGRIL